LHYRATSPESIDDFFKRMGNKSRYNIKRSIRILESSFQKVEYKCYSSINDIEKLSKDLELIASKTYQRGLDAGFILNDEFYDRLNITSKKNMLRTYVLYINDVPVSYWLAFKNDDILSLHSTGYDPTYSNYEIGTALLIHLIKDTAKDKQVKYIDFGWGDALYKRKYANICWNEISFYFFSPKLKGLILNSISTILKIQISIITSIIKKFQIEDKIKKYGERNYSIR